MIRPQRPPKIRRLTNRRNGLGQHQYQARFRIRGNPNPVQITRWAADEADVLLEVARMRGDELPQETHGLTWDAGLRIWFDKVGARMNPQHQRDYQTVVDQFTRTRYDVQVVGKGNALHTTQHEGWGGASGVPIAGTTLAMLSDFMDWRRDRRVAELRGQGKPIGKTGGNAAANKARTLLLALARTLKAEGVLPDVEYSFERVRKRTHETRRSQAVDLELLPQYLDALPTQARLPVEWMLFTGWRSSAACELLDANIDEGRGVAISYTKSRRMGEPRQRREPLDDLLLSIIRRARELKQEMSVQNIHLFVNSDGVAWNNNSLHKRCTESWRAAGLPHRKIHELRTTFGTIAHDQFATAKVQLALGHDSPQATERYKDQNQLAFADVSSAVRCTLSARLLQSDRADADKDGKRSADETVEIICPALGLKALIPAKKARKLFENAQKKPRS